MRQMIMALALLGAVTTGAYAQTSTGAKPKAQSTTTATKPAAAASHSVSGTVKAMDANMLTVTPSGKDKADLMVMLNASTTKEGALAVGSKVSVHYKEENGQKIATAVKASAPKSHDSSAKKK